MENIIIKKATINLVNEISILVFESFNFISQKYNYLCDFPSLEYAKFVVNDELEIQEYIEGIVAEIQGNIIGCSFLCHYDDEVFGIDLVAVSSSFQGKGVGKKLMKTLIEKAYSKGCKSIRLVQDSYNIASFSLYSSLGFQLVEPLAVFKSIPSSFTYKNNNLKIRKMEIEDLSKCNEIHKECNQFERINELKNSILQSEKNKNNPIPHVIENNNGSIVGYSTGITFIGHTISKIGEEGIKIFIYNNLLINQQTDFVLFLPCRLYPSFMKWLLENGFFISKLCNLMCLDNYIPPSSTYIYLPSVVF